MAEEKADVSKDGVDRTVIRRLLALSPAERARLAVEEARRLAEFGLRGAPAGLPLLLDARTLRAGDSFTFDTTVGSLDCLGTPAGTNGYADLATNAVEMDLGEGLRVRFASLDDLLRMKQVAGRPKDLMECEILRAQRGTGSTEH